MATVSIRELNRRTSEIMRHVRDEGETFEITYRGRAVAHLVPVEKRRRSTSEERAAWWTEVDVLAAKIGAEWPAGVSGADAVSEQRRDL